MAKSSTAKTIKSAIAAAHQAVNEVRERIAELKAERVRVGTAPMPFDEAAASLDAQLAAMAKEYDGPYRVSGLLNADRAKDPRDAALDLLPSRDEQVGKWALQQALAHLFGDIISAKLKEDLRIRYAVMERAGALPMPAAERQSALAELDDKLRILESEEEELILEAEDAGIAIARREDTDPAVFLEVH